MSKQSQVEAHLFSGEWITQETARLEFNCWRLAPIIQRLKAKRHNGKRIEVRSVPTGKTRFSTYYIPKTELRRLRKCK